jgi:hypothetical protein
MAVKYILYVMKPTCPPTGLKDIVGQREGTILIDTRPPQTSQATTGRGQVTHCDRCEQWGKEKGCICGNILYKMVLWKVIIPAESEATRVPNTATHHPSILAT